MIAVAHWLAFVGVVALFLIVMLGMAGLIRDMVRTSNEGDVRLAAIDEDLSRR